MLITVKGGNLQYFRDILMEQNKMFRLVGYQDIEIEIIEQSDNMIKFIVKGDLSVDDVSSISNGDFRFYTTEEENEPLVEIEKTLRELHDVCIYQSDALQRIEPNISKMFESFAKSIKKHPEEWVKAIDYYVMDYKSIFAFEEINTNYLELFKTFTNSKMVYIPTLNLLNYFRDGHKFPDIQIVKNPDHIFYITYLCEGLLSIPWRNLTTALDLDLCVQDSDTETVLLKINSPD